MGENIVNKCKLIMLNIVSIKLIMLMVLNEYHVDLFEVLVGLGVLQF